MELPAQFARAGFRGTVHRVVRAGVDPLATEGSLAGGGRYNPAGEFGALYASEEAQTARKEVARGLLRRGVNPASFPPGSWWDYDLEITLTAVLDLTDAAVLSELGIAPGALVAELAAITRQIAAEARSRGYQGLLVPSAASPGAKNLVVFAEGIAGNVQVLESRAISSLLE